MKIADACHTDSDCPTNAECKHDWVGCPKGKCVCKTGYTAKGDNTECCKSLFLPSTIST